MGLSTPKAFLPVANRPMILHTLERFARSVEVRKVIVVAPQDMTDRCRTLVAEEAALRPLEVVLCSGGARRQDSVVRGMECLDRDCEVVLIHDAARPFVSPELIDRAVAHACGSRSVVVAVRARNTIKLVDQGGRIKETVPRELLWEAQTPQVFPVAVIRRAYEFALQQDKDATDDAMLVEAVGEPVYVLEGSSTNLKMTYPEDMLFAEALLSQGLV